MSERRARVTAVCVALSLGCAGASAWAQSESAQDLVRQGFEARRAQRDDEALLRFRAALAIDPSPMVLAQVALAELALGRWRDAAAHLRACLAADDPWIARHRAELEAAAARVDEHLGTLELYDGVDGAEVSLDGEPVGRLPLPGPLRWPVGRVTVRVRAEGYAPLDRAAVIHPGERARESVAQRPADPSPPPAPTVVTSLVAVPVLVTPSLREAPRRVRAPRGWSARVGAAPWVVLGAGVLVGVVATPLFLAGRAAAGDDLVAMGCSLDATGAAYRCPRGDDAVTAAHARGVTYSALADAAWIGGAAIAAAGVAWVVARALGDDAPASVGCASRGCSLEVRF